MEYTDINSNSFRHPVVDLSFLFGPPTQGGSHMHQTDRLSNSFFLSGRRRRTRHATLLHGFGLDIIRRRLGPTATGTVARRDERTGWMRFGRLERLFDMMRWHSMMKRCLFPANFGHGGSGKEEQKGKDFHIVECDLVGWRMFLRRGFVEFQIR